MKIQLAKSATEDLHDVEAYIKQDNPQAARQTIHRVLDAIQYLVEFPAMGRPGRLPRTRELVVSGTPFIVIYQVRVNTLVVLRILHGARRWP